MTLTPTSPTTPRPTDPAIPAPARRQSLRRFLRPYRGSLSLASGLILVETLLDLARPWPLKLAVDNAIGGQPLAGPLGVLEGLWPAGGGGCRGGDRAGGDRGAGRVPDHLSDLGHGRAGRS